MPPLALTGERTLPDVPEENYWFRRHLAVYEWIAERVRGLRVADLACGEGYGADVLARTAAEVVGVDANPEAYEHARLRYRRANLRFERGLVEEFEGPCDAIVFLQTIEHVSEPERPAGALRRRRAARLRHDAQPAHARPARRGEVRQPLAPARVHARPSTGRSSSRTSARVEMLGVFHARKLRVHELALRLGWDRVHRALRLTKPFYDRFVPAISASDFELTRRAATSIARSTSSPSAMPSASREQRTPARRSAIWRSSCTPTCPTSRASGPTRSARSGCSTRWPAPTCRVLERGARPDVP